MNELILKYLEDIKNAIKNIEEDLGEKRFFEEYTKKRTIKQATERNFEIIGEAVNKIIKINPDIKISSTKRIIGLRNRLIHAYDAIDDANIWAIIINHLPTLKSEILDFLKEE
ncbi:MAG: DUF86 domain-containing protein [Bacteroidales bacterium]|nr:DUF86 domain-containing protein [Bacteroidales bacterium]